MRRLVLFVPFCAALVSQCQCRAATPPADYDKKSDLVYVTYGGRKMHLDLYLPKSGKGPFPAVVYIHGGGWNSGNKEMFSQQAGFMAGEGFVGACIEYRLSGEAKYPAALDDSGAAVRWLRGHATEYNIDPGRIGAVGGSSGGQLAGLLGTMKGRNVQAVVEFNPALDLVSLGRMPPSAVQENLRKFLGATYAENPGLWAEAAPMTHVSKDSAPFLFLHGTADTIVPYQQSIDMMNKLKAAGVPAELFTAEGAQHGVLNGPQWFPATAKRMEEFFVKYLGVKSAGQH